MFHAGYSMVLLCMLAGVPCWLLYGVAVHVGWCSMLATLWCCCACWLVFHAVYSMVLLCSMLATLWCCCACWLSLCHYPARACASKGLCDRSWCLYIYKLYIVVCKKNFELFPIFENTHFQTPTSTQKLSSSNLIASYTP